METINPIPEKLNCWHCQGEINKDDVFCGHCGKELTAKVVATSEDVFSILQPSMLYYIITLLLLATYKFTSTFPSGLEGMIIITVIDVSIVIAFWGYSYQSIKPLFSLSGISFRIMSLTIIGAIAGSALVSVIGYVIDLSIHDDVFYNTYLFQDTANPFLFATLFIAVQPAIFEEVAFRGFLFNNLKEVSGGYSTVYITGFIFGIIHLQIISLLWLIPIGLVFGFLRNRYNTLWYGIVGHFTYNLFITLYEFMGWF